MRKEDLGWVGDDAKYGRGGPQRGGNVLQGSDTGGALILIGDLGPISGNGEGGGGGAHRVSEKNHREAGKAEGGRYLGYYQGGSSSGSGGTQS